MAYMFDIRPFFSLVGECDLARAVAKASSWNGFGCGRDVWPLQVLVRAWTECAMACPVVRLDFAAVRGKGQLRGTKAQLQLMNKSLCPFVKN
jgi:hypothetical protein